MKESTTQFQDALRAAMLASRATARRDGVVRMSLDNWYAVTKIPSLYYEGAPRGTNAAYHCRELFNDLAASIDARS